ncbi:SulP family inorganic anion transporter [Alkalibacillus haloalkaliphilus]|uniref:SulP family inorganic anion transporter n=1 Tax=Alkalibacillus haloalkaliphilus TaxID=94136 RepID=UPI0029367E05|nr:solute carrier family 26 protein [Alkalibacillus haloalkaliphilus]MDV2581633.1 solute carrier family 26 protein [Alkalibacillus haloalkaliphilus]
MLSKYVPSVDWLKRYNGMDFKGDLIAGLIVAIMLIPQGMAYAMLAGLPPVMGLYASTIPLIIYALLGSSRQLAVGPVAMVSLLVYSGVSTLAEPGSDQFISYALLLALMVGVIQLAMGLFKLGFLVNFLSHAVISGFTSAAAIIIALSQLSGLLGIELPSKGNVLELLTEAVVNLNAVHIQTVALGIGSIIILILFKKYVPKIPGPLVVVVATSLAVYMFNLDQQGVSIVGDVPSGLPSLSLPSMSWDSITALLPIALTIAFVGFMESVAVAKKLAAKEGYKINSNQELNGLGAANIVGSFFSAFPVTGGFSRSAVNYQSGARTGMATIITAVMIILTLLFFTEWFYYLPQAALAAIIIVAVYGLIDVKEAVHLFKVKRIDGWTLVVTFLATLLTSIETGILTGIVFSLVVFIWRSAYPHVAELGYLEQEGVYRNIERFPEAKTFPNTIIFRIDEALYFANIAFLENKLEKLLDKKPDTNRIILDFSAVNDMDAVAIDELDELIQEYDDYGVEVNIANMKGPVKDLVKKAGWYDKHEDRIQYLSINQCVK